MNRRELIQSIGILIGGTALVGSSAFLKGCASFDKKEYFIAPKDIQLLNEIADIIIPPTADSLGAKAADVGNFMNIIVRDCYTPSEQTTFMEGLTTLKKQLPQNRTKWFDFLSNLDKTAQQYNKNQQGGKHYFSLIKELTIWGYFTSEVGSKAQRYVPVPGYYDGAMHYQKGDKNFGPK